jgi:hypothetical protein
MKTDMPHTFSSTASPPSTRHHPRRFERPAPFLAAFSFLLEVFFCEASLFAAAAALARVEDVFLAVVLRAALGLAAFLSAAGARLTTAFFALLAPAFTAVATKAPAASAARSVI